MDPVFRLASLPGERAPPLHVHFHHLRPSHAASAPLLARLDAETRREPTQGLEGGLDGEPRALQRCAAGERPRGLDPPPWHEGHRDRSPSGAPSDRPRGPWPRPALLSGPSSIRAQPASGTWERGSTHLHAAKRPSGIERVLLALGRPVADDLGPREQVRLPPGPLIPPEPLRPLVFDGDGITRASGAFDSCPNRPSRSTRGRGRAGTFRSPAPITRATVRESIGPRVSLELETLMSSRLFVGNLSWDTTNDTLRQAFESSGHPVNDVHIVMDRETGRPRGFGFVDYKEKASAVKALAEMAGKEVQSPSSWPTCARRHLCRRAKVYRPCRS